MFLVHDRDTEFTASFDAVFAGHHARTIRAPSKAPRTIAICERVLGTMRRECLDRLLVCSRHQPGPGRQRGGLAVANSVSYAGEQW